MKGYSFELLFENLAAKRTVCMFNFFATQIKFGQTSYPAKMSFLGFVSLR